MKHIHFPSSIEEAAAVSSESGGDSIPVGGATSFVFTKARPQAGFIDLSRAGLDYLTAGPHGLQIGSSITVQELAGGDIAPFLPDALVESAVSVGTRQLRNMITLGGNIARIFPWSDLPVPLLALDAVIVIASPDGERSIRAGGYFKKQPAAILKPGDIIKEVLIDTADEEPSGGTATGTSFMKFNRLKRELAYATAAAVVRLEDGCIRDASVVVGGLGALPAEIADATALLIGKEPGEVNEKTVAQTVVNQVTPIRDHRASREYRAHIGGVLTGRAVSTALERAVAAAAAKKTSTGGTGGSGKIRFVKEPGSSPGADSFSDPGKSGSPLSAGDSGGADDRQSVGFVLNGSFREFRCAPDESLLDMLRAEGYTGSKRGCEDGSCGACTVLLDGRTILSCLLPAGLAEGREITTIEGIGSVDNPHPIQKALVDAGGVQCGYCTPGVVLTVKSLLDARPDPTEQDFREALDGNLCRCTGYVKILDGARNAAADLAGAKGVDE